MEFKDEIREAMRTLSQEARDLYLGCAVPETFDPPSALHFFRESVSFNRPLIVRGGALDWPAVDKWTRSYLRDTLGDEKVTVAITPTGYADAIHEGKFVMPLEEKMTMNRFLDILDNPDDFQGVHYIQKQNSNFHDEFNRLFDDVEELPWASEAFGKAPDAINFWMGDSRAVTSTHKDPYENIYVVVNGHKDITLFPPTDAPWLKYDQFQPAIYERDDQTGGFKIKPLPDEREVPWIMVDPDEPNLDLYPEYANAKAYKLRLNTGDVLYLPSLWYHHLKQSHGCIAVNFWYDMEFDVKYNYYTVLQKINKVISN